MLKRSLVPAGLVALSALGPGVAHAREPHPQPGEVSVNLDANFGTGSVNTAIFDAVYTRYLTPLDRKDEVVPILRRHVHHPSVITVHARRDGQPNDVANYLGAGGTFWLGDVSLGGELGGEYVDVLRDDDFESAYIGLRARAEASFRPGELVELGLYYQLRPVLYNLPESEPGQAEAARKGLTHDAGVSFASSTPDDNWYVTGHAGLRWSDWRFEGGFQDGDLSVLGGVADVRLAYQASRRMTYTLAVAGSYLHWDNGRLMDPGQTRFNVDGELVRDVLSIQGEVGIVFWFEGHWGFRAAMGGGYEAAPPMPHNQDRGLVHFGLGFTTRY